MKTEFLDQGYECKIFRADLRNNDEVKKLIISVIDTFGGLDILINNAGWSKLVLPNDLDGLTDDVIKETFSLKVNAPIYTIREAEKYLRKSGRGVVVNITSAAGVASRGSSIVYASANAALYSLTKSFARILSPDVRVNAIAPGYVETGFVFPPDGVVSEKIASQNYTGRCVSPKEITSAVLYLCRDGISITGEEFLLDGGIARLGKNESCSFILTI